jgi:hypothetical protein
MTRRKREITRLANEQDFPHLVDPDEGTAGRLSGSHRCLRSPTGKYPLPVTIAPTALLLAPLIVSSK